MLFITAELVVALVCWMQHYVSLILLFWFMSPFCEHESLKFFTDNNYLMLSCYSECCLVYITDIIFLIIVPDFDETCSHSTRHCKVLLNDLDQKSVQWRTTSKDNKQIEKIIKIK